MASSYDLRAWNTFDAAAQKTLQSGGTVTGGDGRKFILLNGHATTVGSQTYKTLMAQRQANTAAATPARTGPGVAKGPMTPQERIDWSTGYQPPPGRVPNPDDKGPDPFDDEELAKQQRQRDAKARIMSVLSEYGLESLADFVWQQILAGKSEIEVLQDLRNTPEFKTRFPAIEARTKAGMPPLSPGEYVAYERQARQIMRAAGLPESFYDTNDDFTRYLTRDVSLSELNDRIQLGRKAMFEQPREVIDTLMRDYGATEGELTALFLDPDRALPLVEKQWRAAQIGGAGARTGFGSTRAENERLADLGISAEQAQQGFGLLGESRELFQSLDGGEDVIDREEQLGAAFEDNPNARRRIEQRRRRRIGAFEAGGSFATSQTGVSGLGDTR